jgi:ABC-type Mn2+/Zn2+ transport system permease subunit
MAEIGHALTDPFAGALQQRALLEVVLVGFAGGLLGCWIVFYELSYSAESLAHALFPGLVGAALLGLPLLLGAAAGVLAAAGAVVLAGRVPEIGPDTAVAVVITAMFGAGVVLALSAASPPGVQGLLFGDIFGVSDLDLVLAGVLALVVGVALRILHGQLLAVGFDRAAAPAMGGRPLLVDVALLALLALAILVAVQGLGNLLVVAVLVGPAATARLVARRMSSMMALAVAFALIAGAGGLYVSYYAHSAGGASIAGAVVLLYLVVLAVRPLAARVQRRPAAAARA